MQPSNRRAAAWTLGLVSAVLFMVTLDNLVVTTALPQIRVDLGAGLSGLEWIVNSYTLSFAVLLMTGAALGDRFGRRRMLVIGLGIFTAASAAAALAPSTGALIAARALQGVGGALTLPLTLTLLSEAFPAGQRGVALGIWSGISGLGVALGPVVGGAVVQGLSWQWIFWLNVPIGLVTMPLAARALRESRGPATRLDLPGLALATAGMFGLVFGLVRGNAHGWTSPAIVASLAAGAALTLAFLAWERRAAEPMLPLHVFKIRNFWVTMVLTTFVGLGLFGAMTFIPLYQQTVQGASPTVSGLLMTPMMVGSALTSVLAGALTTKTGKYKLFPIVGGAVMAVGMFLLTGLNVGTTRWETAIDFSVLGLGMGLLMQMMSLIAQNSVELKDMGVATSARMFFQQMGGSLGVAAFGAVFASRLNSFMDSATPAGSSGTLHVSGSFDPAQVASLPPAVQQVVFHAVAHGVQAVFWAVLPASVLVFVLALFIKEVPLRGRSTPGEEAAPAPEAEALIG